MDPEQAQESSERDQLWASLRALRPEIARVAAGEWEALGRQLGEGLARIVQAGARGIRRQQEREHRRDRPQRRHEKPTSNTVRGPARQFITAGGKG